MGAMTGIRQKPHVNLSWQNHKYVTESLLQVADLQESQRC